jgi:hypothetical protein
MAPCSVGRLADRPGVEDPSAHRRCPGHQAPCESESVSDLLRRGVPPTASSSLHPSHERLTLAAAMSSSPPPRVAKVRTT